MPSVETDEPSAIGARRVAFRRQLGWVTLLYWTALFISTHVPLPEFPPGVEGADRVVHVAAFAGLGFLCALWLALGDGLNILSAIGLFALLAVYGGLDEWLQQFVRRSTDVVDWYADMIGAAIGTTLVLLVTLCWPRLADRDADAVDRP